MIYRFQCIQKVDPFSSTPKTGRRQDEKQDATKLDFDIRDPTNWSTVPFIPASMSRIRKDWEDGVLLDASGSFQDLDADDVATRLGEFVEMSIPCYVERLRMSDIKGMVRHYHL